MAYSFDGVTFSPMITDAAPRVSRTVSQTRRHVPFSGTDIIDFGGLEAGVWAGKVRVVPSSAANLESKLGTKATLIIDGITYTNAAMSKCEGHVITPRREFHVFDVEFMIP